MGLLGILIGSVTIVIVVGILSFLKFQVWRHERYFRKRGIPFIPPNYVNMIRFLSGKMTMIDMELALYKDALKIDSPFVGYSDSFAMPGVIVTDLDLVRSVYVKDFDHFVNRRTIQTQKGDKFFKKMIILADGEHWKGMRSKLSPTFTTGKIRKMFSIFDKSSNRMCDFMTNIVGPGGGDYDICEVYSKYAMDVIATAAFGIDSKSYECDQGKLSEFEDFGQQFQFRFKPSKFFMFIVILAAPKLADFLGFEIAESAPQEYFEKVIKKVLKHRRETGVRQEDFLQLMMDVQAGTLKNDENNPEVIESGKQEKGINEASSSSPLKFSFDDDDIIANCMLFMVAGYDTLQSLLIFTAYALALEPEVQQKLREEINRSMEKNGGKLTYEAIHEMNYLDMFVNETLRCYSPAVKTERTCTKNYVTRLRDKDVVIEKGIVVNLPVLGVHKNPEFYDKPDKFIPERFLPEEKSKRSPYSFQAFGHGNRNCVGMRFALTEAKTVIATLVHRFNLEPSSKTDIPMIYSNSNSLKPENGMWLHITPRQ